MDAFWEKIQRETLEIPDFFFNLTFPFINSFTYLRVWLIGYVQQMQLSYDLLLYRFEIIDILYNIGFMTIMRVTEI